MNSTAPVFAPAKVFPAASLMASPLTRFNPKAPLPLPFAGALQIVALIFRGAGKLQSNNRSFQLRACLFKVFFGSVPRSQLLLNMLTR